MTERGNGEDCPRLGIIRKRRMNGEKERKGIVHEEEAVHDREGGMAKTAPGGCGQDCPRIG